MLHAPDTASGMFTAAQTLELVHCPTVWVVSTKEDYRCRMLDLEKKRKHACLWFVFPSSS